MPEKPRRASQPADFMNEQRAKKIITAIESKIGFDGDLVKTGVGDSNLYTHSNASFGLLDYVLGNEQRARKIRTAIESKIGFDGDLVKWGVGDSNLYTYPNASFGLLDIAGKLKQIYDERKQNLGGK